MRTFTTFVLAFALPFAGAPSTLAQPPSGSFRSAAHPTSGGVRIVEDNGHQYVELQGNFRTTAGPDLKVVLHRSANPTSYARGRYLNLGLLRRTSGQQRYRLPDGLDLSRYRSVAIWCEEFDITFGVAALR